MQFILLYQSDRIQLYNKRATLSLFSHPNAHLTNTHNVHTITHTHGIVVSVCLQVKICIYLHIYGSLVMANNTHCVGQRGGVFVLVKLVLVSVEIAHAHPDTEIYRELSNQARRSN